MSNGVSIIILSYNNLELNKGLLNSIRSHTDPASYELIFVDNASTDGTRKWLQEQTGIKLVLNDENAGFPQGCNQGIGQASRGNDILLLNNDIEVTKNWLENLKTALYSGPGIGAVQGLDSRSFPGLIDGAGNPTEPDVASAHEFAQKNNISDPSRWEYSLTHHGYCMLIKRSVLDRVGLLDVRFTPGNFEDDDLSFRIIKEGFFLLRCYDCHIHHYNCRSFKANEEAKKNYDILLNTNWRKFFGKWGFDAWEKDHLRNDLLKLVKIESKSEINVLHVGCRLGQTLLAVKTRNPGAKLFGIEKNPHYLNVINKVITVGKEKKDGEEGVLFDFNHNFFDVILIDKPLAQFENPEKYLMQLKEYLKPGGQLVFNMENIMHFACLEKLLTGVWPYTGKLAMPNNKPLVTSSDIKGFCSDCGYVNPLVFAWKNHDTSKHSNLVEKLCAIGSPSKKYAYQISHFTISVEKEAEIPDKGFKAHYFEIGDDLYVDFNESGIPAHDVIAKLKVDLLHGHYKFDSDAKAKFRYLEQFDGSSSYTNVIVPKLPPCFKKRETLELAKKLIGVTGTNLLIAVDENESGVVGIPDFREFDFSFFELADNRFLFKIYKRAKTQIPLLPGLANDQRKLTVAFVMPHRNLTGGMKLLYQQALFLQQLGHAVKIVNWGSHYAMPEWLEDFVPDDEISVLRKEDLLDKLTSSGSDLIFVGWYEHLLLLENKKIPVLYWEQGHEFLYGDMYGNKEYEVYFRNNLRRNFSSNIYLAANSSYVRDVVKTRFKKDSYVVPCSINNDLFYPAKDKKASGLPVILLVGDPNLRFKGFYKAIRTLLASWEKGLRFKVVWLCHRIPETLPAYPFEVEFNQGVPQREIAGIYRKADLLLTCSWYEGFSMPTLEAMACGVPVVATNMGGIDQFCIHGKNIMVAASNSVDELSNHVISVLGNESLRNDLIFNGLETAKNLSADLISKSMEQVLVTVVADFNLSDRG